MTARDVTDEEFRAAGFTGAAKNYPRSELGFVMLCAFNGVDPELAPAAWRYYPGDAAAEAWNRVAKVAENYFGDEIERWRAENQELFKANQNLVAAINEIVN